MFSNEQNLSVGEGGAWVQAGRDINGDISIRILQCGVSLPIIEEIIGYICEQGQPWHPEGGNWIWIREKAELNFKDESCKNDFKEVYYKSVEMMWYVRRFLETCDRNKVDSMIARIQKLFMESKDSDSFRKEVGSVRVLMDMAEKILPRSTSQNDKDWTYLKHTISIVLLVFEMCDFWIKVKEEPQLRLIE